MTSKSDIVVYDGGTGVVLRPTSRRGTRWLTEHIAPDALRLGAAVCVEHRYVGDIVAGAVADGLVVR